MPIDHGVAGIASRYLRDGYQPDEVAHRLGIDHGWCRQMTARLRGGK